MWFASSCGRNDWDGGVKRRDYRVAHLDDPSTCGPFVDGMCVNLKTFWQKKERGPTAVRGRRTYTAHVDTPTDGTWRAFFVSDYYGGCSVEGVLITAIGAQEDSLRPRGAELFC
jgi:hypothetical protein